MLRLPSQLIVLSGADARHQHLDYLVALVFKSSAFLKRAKITPILLTRTLMYPGGFLVRELLEIERAGGSDEDLRTSRAHGELAAILVSYWSRVSDEDEAVTRLVLEIDK